MSLPLARNRLHDAVSALCDPTWHQHHPLDSRYHQLRDAITDAHISGHARTPAATIIPCQIDCLKLKIKIDKRTQHHTPHTHIHNTPDRLQWLTTQKWRPQDTEHLETITAEIQSWAKEIDDLLTPQKPLNLPNPCPQCGHNWAHRKNDDGDIIRTRALAVTTAGALCRQCHAHWPVEKLAWLGHVLGTYTGEITA
jgi:hypothetical protein